MLLGTGWIVTALVAGLLAASAVRPVPAAGTQGSPGRDARMLRRRPDRVTHRDVERLLHTASVAPAHVAQVMGRARSRRYSARTLWRWAAVHGCDRLVLVVDAGVGEAALLDHLRAGTEPDWRTLALFAELAAHDHPVGLPAEQIVDLDATPGPDAPTFPAGLEDWAVDTTDPTDPADDLFADLFDGLLPDPERLDERGPEGPDRRRFTA